MGFFDGRGPSQGPKPNILGQLGSLRGLPFFSPTELGALTISCGDGTRCVGNFPKLVDFLSRFGEFLREDTLPVLAEFWLDFDWKGGRQNWVGHRNQNGADLDVTVSISDTSLKIRLSSTSCDFDAEHILRCANSAVLMAIHSAKVPTLKIHVSPNIEFQNSPLVGFPTSVDLELVCYLLECPERGGITFLKELLGFLEDPELILRDQVNNRRVKTFLDQRSHDYSFRNFELPLTINPIKDGRQPNNSDRPKRRVNTLLALVGPESPDK